MSKNCPRGLDDPIAMLILSENVLSMYNETNLKIEDSSCGATATTKLA